MRNFITKGAIVRAKRQRRIIRTVNDLHEPSCVQANAFTRNKELAGIDLCLDAAAWDSRHPATREDREFGALIVRAGIKAGAKFLSAWGVQVGPGFC